MYCIFENFKICVKWDLYEPTFKGNNNSHPDSFCLYTWQLCFQFKVPDNIIIITFGKTKQNHVLVVCGDSLALPTSILRHHSLPWLAFLPSCHVHHRITVASSLSACSSCAATYSCSRWVIPFSGPFLVKRDCRTLSVRITLVVWTLVEILCVG